MDFIAFGVLIRCNAGQHLARLLRVFRSQCAHHVQKQRQGAGAVLRCGIN
ncbi:hypothetical protein NX02_00060 [Sphingomonas sanxanigenens DSM 19645 = NX02]|uniref:Uncharacterized protein n=1 Tax=Sphingomonas sanxanigenens DSM 19645 = NX02 TaxID=1123269 RepID=W0A417_9SPHN|nr:hypothetical protein NX02_00060 [Sphingomonas sanxanigenens DSM 19645 = NX02]